MQPALRVLPSSLVHACVVAALGVLSGCGAGVIGVIASAGDGDGGSAQPAVAAFGVEDPKEPELTRLHFNLNLPAVVELLYLIPGGAPLPMAHAGSNPRAFPAGSHAFSWNFALEDGLSTRFLPGVLVFARIPGVQEQPRGGENAATLGLGNDAPEIEEARPPPGGEVSGIAAARLRVSDTSSDPVSIRAEFDVFGDVPDLGWRIARPGGLLPGEPTPEHAFSGVIAPAGGGVQLDFFWNTDFDLAHLDREVSLRFTALDPVVEGASEETGGFRVDNNAEPVVVLELAPSGSSPDERRGIPLPFRVSDEESDEVEVLFQWSPEGEDFPALEAAELDAILADPALRRAKRIASSFPRYARGRLVPVDATNVRLPELTAQESWILAAGIVGRSLEILRAAPAGGIEQRRTIAAYAPLFPGEPRAQLVTLDSPLDPVPEQGRPWRIRDEPQRLSRATPQGVLRSFLWDSGDRGAGAALLRAFARDGELGAPTEPLLVNVQTSPQVVGTPLAIGGAPALGFPRSVTAGDLDGDGDLELVAASPTSAVRREEMSADKGLRRFGGRSCHYTAATSRGAWIRSRRGRSRPSRSINMACACSGLTTQRTRSFSPSLVGSTTSALCTPASSSNTVRGQLPSPARRVHCSSVFHST